MCPRSAVSTARCVQGRVCPRSAASTAQGPLSPRTDVSKVGCVHGSRSAVSTARCVQGPLCPRRDVSEVRCVHAPLHCALVLGLSVQFRVISLRTRRPTSHVKSGTTLNLPGALCPSQITPGNFCVRKVCSPPSPFIRRICPYRSILSVQPKPSPVRNAVRSAHQESHSASTEGLARDDPQPSQILN